MGYGSTCQHQKDILVLESQGCKIWAPQVVRHFHSVDWQPSGLPLRWDALLPKRLSEIEEHVHQLVSRARGRRA